MLYSRNQYNIAMANHDSILACGSPWIEEPDRLQSTRSYRVGHDWVAKTTNTSIKINKSKLKSSSKSIKYREKIREEIINKIKQKKTSLHIKRTLPLITGMVKDVGTNYDLQLKHCQTRDRFNKLWYPYVMEHKVGT